MRSRDGKLQTSPAVIDYVRASYLDAWRSSVDAVNSSFPEVIKLLSAPVSMICWPDNDGAAFYFEVYKVDLVNPDPGVQLGVSAIRDPSLCQ